MVGHVDGVSMTLRYLHRTHDSGYAVASVKHPAYCGVCAN
ncbi:MAG: hypothetical protein ACI81O_000519 [Cyclobacteriaceae bacterium]|jgi:hypothetical protein